MHVADSEMYTDIEIPEMLDYAGANALPSGVPPPVWVALSPANTLPVRDLLLRHTPRVSSGAFSTITFSSDEPTHLLFPESDNAEFVQTIISSLLKAPLPSAASMEAIRTQSLELQAASRRSILLAFDGLKAHLPTWVGECVARMVTVENATQLWSGASRWLRSPASMEDAKLTVECEQRLASMGWNTSVSAYRTASLTTPDLASLLGTSWIGEDHMNAGGEWINRQLGPKSFIRVLDTHFLSNLRHNHRHFPTWSPSHPAELDQLVCNGDVTFLIVPVYLLERWAYLHVNVIDGSCVYVDSLHPDNVLVPDEVMNLFDWWLETVRPDLGPLSEELPTFEVERQLDRHSSGPATLSTMAHVALGGEPWTRAKAPQHRKRWFLRFSTEFETFLEVSSRALLPMH